MDKWDKRFVDLAHLIAGWSKDRSTKVGAVIVGRNREVISTGFNGFPPGIDDEIEERHERPVKYLYTEHAERNAIYLAAANGAGLRGTNLYVTMHPCAECARAIIRTGVTRLVTRVVPQPLDTTGNWRDGCLTAQSLLREAGVSITEYD